MFPGLLPVTGRGWTCLVAPWGFVYFYITVILKSRHPLPSGYNGAVTFVYLHFPLLSAFLVAVLGDKHAAAFDSVRWRRKASLGSCIEEAIGDF